MSLCELWFFYSSSSVLVPLGPSLCGGGGASGLAALPLWHHAESRILQNCLSFIVMTACVRPSVPSILLLGAAVTYSSLLSRCPLPPQNHCVLAWFVIILSPP